MEHVAQVLVEHDVSILLLGDSGVGKSAMLARFDKPEAAWRPHHESTIGIAMCEKKKMVHDRFVRIRLWDTAGQERFRAITTSYYRGAHACALVYDITNRESFGHVAMWINEISKALPDVHLAGGEPPPPGRKHMDLMIVGAKCDLEEERRVARCEGEALASQHGAMFCEASAKQDVNVQEVFMMLAECAVAWMVEAAAPPPPPRQFLVLDGTPQGGSDDGCGC